MTPSGPHGLVFAEMGSATATWEDEMTVLRTALEASLTDPRFVGDELIPTLSVGTTAHLTSMRPRLAGPPDQDEVSAELSTPDGELVFLTAFGRDEDAESTYRVLDALWTSGLG